MTTAQQDPILRYLRRLVASRDLQERSDLELLDAFAARRQETAFAALVGRHGPMVLRVCRRVLGHEQDAEDAFQATFLVLAQSSKTIRKRAALADWLHGVAYRTAMNAKRSAARRRTREQRLPPELRPSVGPTWNEVQAALDEELRKLSEPFRQAFVLCVLEGKSGTEAAALLGCKPGTVSSRVTRARQQLQRQLTRRGINLGTLLAALAVAEATSKAVAGVLVHSTVRYGLLAAAGATAASQIPAHVSALAQGVSGAMFSTKLKVVTAVLLTAGLVAAGAGVLAHQAVPATERPAASQKSDIKNQKLAPAADAKGDRFEVRGRVLDPDGKPCVGAKMFICDNAGKSVAPQPATDGNGCFRFVLPVEPVWGTFLLATAAGLGLDWVDIQRTESRLELTLRLPADVPIRGKIIDLEGKPVSGASVRIVELSTSASGTLDEFLNQWAADKDKSPTGPAFHLLTKKRLWAPWAGEAMRQFPAATSGPDGTFRLTGIGRDRGLMLAVRSPRIADHYVRVVTRPDFVAVAVRQGQVALCGPEPVVAVAPCRPIVGTLRDAKTKQPLAGVRVRAYTPGQPMDWWQMPVEAVTDALGRYRLEGLAKARQIVLFDPGAGTPHMHRFDEVGDREGFAPITHDAELYRGIMIHGQVTDRSSGRPVRARVVYAPLFNNGNYTTTPGYARPQFDVLLWVDSREMITTADGRYKLTALPGPGALFVHAVDNPEQFTQPSVRKEDRDPVIYAAGAETFMTLGLGDMFPMSHLNAYRLVRPVGDDATEFTVNFALDPGARRRGRLVDPAGRPVPGGWAIGLTPYFGPRSRATISGPEFVAQALNPAKPRRLLIWNDERKLAGTVVLRGDEPEPVTVTLQPLATLTGRAILKNGEPLVGYAIEYGAPWQELEWPGHDLRLKRAPLVTDKEGRFRVTDLPAGIPLDLAVIAPKTQHTVIRRQQIILEPGKTTALGEMRGRSKYDQ
ncbi:MAG TPA: sigma-70 family RNA polymerase sigma factor [Gemmataceae bacterium]|jgi:RNA polymerase sigma factor (sigma-70 family)|nr:sigma-70 family RNA polymerase sigma factor [Gemmataceae bacterium]